MSKIENQKAFIEIFSLDLNGWIQLNLHQFSQLITPHMNSFGEEDEFDLDSSGLHYKLFLNSLERLSLDQIREGDFYEIQKEENLSIKLSNWYNGGLKLDLLNRDIANHIEEWQDKNKTISQKFTLFTRCKVLLKDEDNNEVVVSLSDESIQGDYKTEKISVDRIRLLSHELNNENPFKISLNDRNNSGLKLKIISSNYLIRKFNLDEELVNVDLYKSNVDLIKLFSDSPNQLENVFFDHNNTSKTELTLVSTHLNLLFISHLLAIKLKNFIESQKLVDEIKKETEKIESVNKIIETREKRKIKFSLKYLNAIKTKILNNLSKDDFSYVIDESEDFFEVLIYEIGKSGSLKKLEKDFEFKEDLIKVDFKMAEWIKSKESKEELDRMIDYYIEDNLDKEEIYVHFLGDASHLNNFKKLLQIHFGYYEKLLKMKKETESIKKEINSLTNELKLTQKKEIKNQQK